MSLYCLKRSFKCVYTAGRTINTQECLTDEAFQFKRHIQFISLDARAM